MNSRIVSIATVLAVLLAGSSWAHHSGFAVADPSKRFTLTGTLTKVDWRNPHIQISLEAKDDRGLVDVWTMETATPRWFLNRNVTRNDFEKAIGQTITVEAFRARDGSLHGLLQKITFRDGRAIEGYIQSP